MTTKTYTIARFSSRDNLDWSKVTKAHIDIHKWNKEMGHPCWAQMAYIDAYGFVCKMHCDQVNPWVFCHEEGGEVYKDSALELFLCFGDNQNPHADYLNIEVNAEGVSHQKYGNKADGRYELNSSNGKAFDVNASIDKQSWEIFIQLPIEKIQALRSNFDVKNFHLNFYKTGLNPKTGNFHYQMWNECTSETPNFHPVAFYGDAVLGELIA